MQFEPQLVFDVLLSVISLLGGWVLRVIWTMLRDLQKADREMITKVQAIEVLVAGKYVTREELERHMTALFKKLDYIAEKLDGKADKE